MEYFYERNITEIKQEYTTFLVNILTPLMYEGIKSLYYFAIKTHNELIERGKFDPSKKSPGVLKIFQTSLKEVPTLNNNTIEEETIRIKNASRCSEWFDDLVRAVIKSNITLLSFSNPKKRPEILKQKYHEKIEIKDFIHKCYVETARLIYNNPELFWHDFSPLEIKRNQREACELIERAIQEAVRKMLPIKMILNEFLNNNYIEDDDGEIDDRISDSKYMNIKSMVNRDLYDINKLGGSLQEPEIETQVRNANEKEKELMDQDSPNVLDEPKKEFNQYNQEKDNYKGENELNIFKEQENIDSENLLDSHDEKMEKLEQGILETEFLNSAKFKIEKLEKEIDKKKPIQENKIEEKELDNKDKLSKEHHKLEIKKEPNVKIIIADNLLNPKQKKENKKEKEFFEGLIKNINVDKQNEPDKTVFLEHYMK